MSVIGMTGSQPLINNMSEPVTEGGHQCTGAPAHQRIGAMDQYYEICNINIIVQIWMCPCGDSRSSVEYLSCIFVANIYAVYFG